MNILKVISESVEEEKPQDSQSDVIETETTATDSKNEEKSPQQTENSEMPSHASRVAEEANDISLLSGDITIDSIRDHM